jgi:hypothetical protein
LAFTIGLEMFRATEIKVENTTIFTGHTRGIKSKNDYRFGKHAACSEILEERVILFCSTKSV